MHGGDSVLVDTNHHIVKNQLTALAAAGHLDDLAVLHAHLGGVGLGDVQVTLSDNDALGQLHLALGTYQLTCAGALHVAALTDGGIDAPVRESGDVKGSGACKLVGPKGEVELTEGVIIAKRHLHITEADAAEMGVKNGEIIKVACGGEGRKLIFDDVVVRVNKDAVTTMHIDTDESQAAGNPKVGEIVR